MKPKGKDTTAILKFISAALVLVLLLVLFIKPGINNSIIFLYSDRCGECKNIEPTVKDITDKAGMRFYRIKYDEPGFTPGLIFIYNNTLLITGYRDGDAFKKQLCGFTKSKKACSMAGESWG